ncbi:MAG: WD40 repeat domain-containing protein [Methanoregula sp.]|nr:WD40 repeat domain-containing protein [Methanoregula sp.]
MKNCSLVFLCGVVLLLGFIVPVTGAVTPLWIEHGMKYGELSGVVISEDGSTILTGGDQIISLDPEGKNRWTGWSATCLAVSSDGDYILSSQGQELRLISAAGKIIWEKNMDITITDIAMTPNASLIAATGGGRTRTLDIMGEGIASNITMDVKHIRILPGGDRIVVTTNTDVHLSNKTLLSEWSEEGTGQNLVEVSPARSTFVTAINTRVRLYNRTGGILWDNKFPHGNAYSLAFSRDGSTIVIGTDGSRVLVIDRNGTLLWREGAGNWITSVAVSDDGNTIAAGSLDKKLYVYNRAGTLLGTFTAQTPINDRSVAVSRDGSLIVLVDDTAIYAFLRSSFPGGVAAGETTVETSPEMTPETPSPATTRPTTTITFKTFTPIATGTPESPLPPAVLLVALGILLLFRPGRS